MCLEGSGDYARKGCWGVVVALRTIMTIHDANAGVRSPGFLSLEASKSSLSAFVDVVLFVLALVRIRRNVSIYTIPCNMYPSSVVWV